jgi:hypothetical protein
VVGRDYFTPYDPFLIYNKVHHLLPLIHLPIGSEFFLAGQKESGNLLIRDDISLQQYDDLENQCNLFLSSEK